jgi:hypothetical protein
MSNMGNMDDWTLAEASMITNAERELRRPFKPVELKMVELWAWCYWRES